MSPLFKRIYSLLRQGQIDVFEDYLTEIVAEIFEDTDMLIKFFNEFTKIKLENPSKIRITTQKTFHKLPGHETNSKPDIVIQFIDNEKPFIAFFENKLYAKEGDNQLKRYVDHLKVYEDNGFDTSLFYVTKYYDPKEENGIIQLRWYKIYNWLNNNRSQFVNKVTDFMEELKLNETRRFVPHDVHIINEINRVQSMLDECIDGQVEDTLKRLFVGSYTANRNKEVKNIKCYFKTVWIGTDCPDKKASSFLECGFKNLEQEYPTVTVTFQVYSKYSKWDEAIEAMEWFLESHDDWRKYVYSNRHTGISCEVSLLDFLNQDDHITSIQEYFIEKLNELHLIKQQYSDLDWKV